MLDKVIQIIYNANITSIKRGNIKGEMAEFGPFISQILGYSKPVETCYAREMENMQEAVSTASVSDLNQILTILEDVFYFSKGHDMVYKKKIESDCFMHEPLDDLILPQIQSEVRSLFNDISVLPENPHREKSISIIESIVAKHIDFNSLLFLLYTRDWQFPRDWQQLYPETSNELEEMIQNSTITIGDFLNSLVDFKAGEIKKVLLGIKDLKLKEEYLKKVDSISSVQKSEITSFSHTHLPVGYFKDKTMMDFLNEPKPSSSKIIL